MKKEVLIKIKGVQISEGEQDVTELFTQGFLYKKKDAFYVTYEETETTGFTGCLTTLKVESHDKVVLMRNGPMRSHLIMEQGKRNIGHYGTSEGNLMIGVYSKEVSNQLTEDGGDVYFSYSLDINSSLISDNEVFVNISNI